MRNNNMLGEGAWQLTGANEEKADFARKQQGQHPLASA